MWTRPPFPSVARRPRHAGRKARGGRRGGARLGSGRGAGRGAGRGTRAQAGARRKGWSGERLEPGRVRGEKGRGTARAGAGRGQRRGPEKGAARAGAGRGGEGEGRRGAWTGAGRPDRDLCLVTARTRERRGAKWRSGRGHHVVVGGASSAWVGTRRHGAGRRASRPRLRRLGARGGGSSTRPGHRFGAGWRRATLSGVGAEHVLRHDKTQFARLPPNPVASRPSLLDPRRQNPRAPSMTDPPWHATAGSGPPRPLAGQAPRGACTTARREVPDTGLSPSSRSPPTRSWKAGQRKTSASGDPRSAARAGASSSLAARVFRRHKDVRRRGAPFKPAFVREGGDWGL